MHSLVVSTWHRGNFEQQTFDPTQRLNLLRQAVAKADSVSKGNSRDTGLIKGIFVAPEYSFAAELAGISFNGDPTRARSMAIRQAVQARRGLQSLSRDYPRLLIIPGSMAWKMPIDEAEFKRRIKYYAKRQLHKPTPSGDDLTR